MPRNSVSFIVAFVFSAAAIAAPAAADDWKDCSLQADPAAIVAACSAIVERAGETASNRAKAYNIRGKGYIAKRDFAKAIADYNRAIELTPNDSAPYSNRADANVYAGQSGPAVADYSRAIELEPGNALLYGNRGTVYVNMGEFAKAIPDLNRTIELKPDYMRAYGNRAIAYAALGSFDKAAADSAKAFELSPVDWRSRAALGIVKFDVGDFKGASAALEHPFELGNTGDAVIYSYLASARAGETSARALLGTHAGALKTKDWPYPVVEYFLGQRSLELMLSAAATPVQQCEAQFYLGEALILQNNPAEAQAALRKAAETCPKSHAVYAASLAELQRLKP